MQSQTSPLILSFGIYDPLGATGIHADMAIYAALGCHGLSAMTQMLINDTARCEGVQCADAEWLIDTARTLLEDMPVSAFKIGPLGSVENVSAVAEIAADYPDIPLIFDPFCFTLYEQEQEDEMLFRAMRELLIPQSTILQLSAAELTNLAQTWRNPSDADMLIEDATHLINYGCEFLQVTDCPADIDTMENKLFGEQGLIRQDVWQRLPGSFIGAGNCLSAAITGLLAGGFDISEASLEAQEFTLAALAHARRIGMGKLIPDFYFWAKEDKENH